MVMLSTVQLHRNKCQRKLQEPKLHVLISHFKKLKWRWVFTLLSTIQKNSKVSTKIKKIIGSNLPYLAIRQREADITKERVEKILASGANVILTTGGIDDLNTKYFVEKGAMGVRRVLKKDLKRIAKATGGKKNHKFLFYLLLIKMVIS